MSNPVSNRVSSSQAGRAALLLVIGMAIVACATPAPPQPAAPAALTTASSELMVALIRQQAGEGFGELAVQPIRDPAVEDLRNAAQAAAVRRDYAASAKAFDEALAIVPDDPALLQERAEVALLLKDYAGAEQRAKRAFEIGAQVGPLCRRHWATVQQVRLHAGDADGAAMAKREVDGCKVAGVDRF